MILESIEHAGADVSGRMLVEARVEADRMLNALNQAIQQDRALLTNQELASLEEGILSLKEARTGTNHRLILDRTEKLDALSVEFASRRMDRSINEALAGKKTSEV
jgi:molecular chaperone HscA